MTEQQREVAEVSIAEKHDKRAAYMREYYAKNPDQRTHRNELSRENMRKKRADPEFRMEERVRRELALMQKDRNNGLSKENG